MPNQKGVAIVPLVILLVVGVVIVGAVWYTMLATKSPAGNANSTTNQVVVNTNTVASVNAAVDTSDWQTYKSEILGLTFKYPPGTQVNFYPDAMLAGVIRVVSEADPNKDSDLYSMGIGPGPIGIVSYVYQSDLKSFAEGFASGKISAQPASVAGVSGFRITGVLESSDNRVLGSRIADVDYYYITYNAATWGFEYDDNAEIESSPTHEDFINILSTVEFTVKE